MGTQKLKKVPMGTRTWSPGPSNGDPCGSSGQGVGRQEEGPYGPGGKERGPVLLHGPHKGAWGEKERSVKLFVNVNSCDTKLDKAEFKEIALHDVLS